ncbi:MAG: hypothetical protein AABO58_09705 [Acidobacteriota bacterium]
MPLRIVLASLAALLLLVAAALFITPPVSLVRAVALTSAPFLMNPAAKRNRAQQLASKVVGAYVQTSLAGQIARRIRPSEADSDEQAIATIVSVVQHSGLNQQQLDHLPKGWPSLLSGLGFCDQINGAAATIAARRFGKVELFALYDAGRSFSPHTVCRVWSKERNDWIYFDAFYAEPVIFTRKSDGTPHYVHVGGGPPVPSRGTPVWSYYRLPGWVLADMRASFGELVMTRMISAGVEPAPPIAAPYLVPATSPVPPRFNEKVYRRVARAYVGARLDHLLGGSAHRAEYLAIGADKEAASDTRAAELAFAARKLAALSE